MPTAPNEPDSTSAPSNWIGSKVRAYLLTTHRKAFKILIIINKLFDSRSHGGLAAGFLLVIFANGFHAVDGLAAETGTLHLRCTNVSGGANWPIEIDLDHAIVGSIPAKITERWISWHDPSKGYLDLERVTGKLDIRIASSTGGFFLHYICRPE
jgi:hypothetical protein